MNTSNISAMAVNTSATSISTARYDLFISAIQFVVFGSVSIVTNLVIIFILLRNLKYFKKAALIAGLALGDLIYGVSLAVIGIQRITRYLDGTDSLTVRPSWCMAILINPMLLMGNQIPGVMFCLIGVERFLAVYRYDWYYIKWSNKFAWTLTACVYIVCTTSVSIPFVTAFTYDSRYKIGIACGTASLVGPTYSAYNYGIGILGGILASVATVIATAMFTKRKNRLSAEGNVPFKIKNHMKKQWQLTRSALCLSVVDFCFMVIPSCIITLSSGFNVNFHVNLTDLKVWSLQLVCFRSILNVIIYFFVNSEFRSATMTAVRFKHGSSSMIFANSVSPIQNHIQTENL